MLRVGKTVKHEAAYDADPPRLGGGSMLPVKRVPGTTQANLWKDLGRSDLDDIVRQICTLCGSTQTTVGAGQSLAITSALQGEGKSTLARAMAISMAQDHEGEVLLLECDLFGPSLGNDFGSGGGPGVTEVLTGEAVVTEALRPTRFANLWLMTAGGAHDSPSRLLRSPSMATLLDELRGRFSFVVVDLPAVLKSSDAAVIARQTDGAVLVVRTGATNQRQVQQALQLMAGATIHGVVLNRWKTKVPGLIRRLVEL